MKLLKHVKWISLGIILCLITLILFLSTLDPSGDYDGQHQKTEGNTVTYILLDGLSKAIFESELAAGNLPVIDRLINKSTYVKNGIGSFPTMTGYAFYPFLTGVDAAESGIFGLRWFDRSRQEGNLRNYVGRTNIHMNQDIRPDVLNVFEKYDHHYTASINTYMNRGVHHSLKTGWAHTTAKYSSNFVFPWLRSLPKLGENIAKDHFQHETLVTDLAIKQLEKNPKVQWITYPSLDAHHHVHGTDTTYYQLLHHLDRQIGRLLQVVEPSQKRAIVIVSDHGISDVSTNLDIPKSLSEQGLSLERGPSTHLFTDQLDTPLEEFMDRDGYFVINGNLGAFLYMKKADKSGVAAWRNKNNTEAMENYKKVNLPIFISNIKGIDIVATYDEKQGVKVVKNGSIMQIQQSEEGKFSYHLIGEDIFGYEGLITQDSLYSKNELLTRTLSSEYPYALPRLYQLLSHPSGPDLVMTSLPGYDLAKDYEIFVDNYLGGHGGIRKEQIVVPYIAYFPGHESKTVNAMTAEQLGQRVIQYLKD